MRLRGIITTQLAENVGRQMKEQAENKQTKCRQRAAAMSVAVFAEMAAGLRFVAARSIVAAAKCCCTISGVENKSKAAALRRALKKI